MLDNISSSEQTGYIPGRYIGENTRLIYDIMQYTEDTDIPRVLMMIDFEKHLILFLGNPSINA